MTTKTLEVSLGQVVIPSQVVATGYYTDPVTGQLYYYNASLDQWYYVAAGLLYPLALSWQPSPSAKIDLVAGNTLRFNLVFWYLGPAVIRDFYAAIGSNTKSGSFNEWSGYTATKSISIPTTSVLTLITGNFISILIPTGHQGEDGAAYCKIMNGITLTEGVNCTPLYYDVCHIVPAVGEFAGFSITSFVKA